MRNLLLFLRKFHFFFIALALEILSLVLLLNFNLYQNSLGYTISTQIAGSVKSLTHQVNTYFSLKVANQQLAQELARIHARLPQAYYRTDLKSYLSSDSVVVQQYKFVSAQVVSNTTNRRNNFLMLDKGLIHGLKNHMGVVFGNSIVGQIVGISPHFSWVMSVLNKNARISGKFLKNNQLVNVEWEGGSYLLGQVKEIPKHVDIKIGDTIVTSGNSDIYPGAVLIGTIESFEVLPEENFNEATIRFVTDFNNLEFVEVVIDLMKAEKDQLKNSVK